METLEWKGAPHLTWYYGHTDYVTQINILFITKKKKRRKRVPIATFPLYSIGQSRLALWSFLGGWLRPQHPDEGVSSLSRPGPILVSRLSSLPPIWANPQRWPEARAAGVGAVGSALGCQEWGGSLLCLPPRSRTFPFTGCAAFVPSSKCHPPSEGGRSRPRMTGSEGAPGQDGWSPW